MKKFYLFLVLLLGLGTVRAQDLVWTADYPIQDFQRIDSTGTFDVLYRTIERNWDTSNWQLQVAIQVGLQWTDRPQLALTPNTEVVRYEGDRLITLSNPVAGSESGGKLDLYQIGADSLISLRRWTARNKAKLGVVESQAPISYL
ncbi:MAG: hypothetical protein KDC44_07425, partial [Phaeodactylibacter sp.]|nr:hypothetical protein [Phaeodactylibacter sp.]